MKLLGWQSKLRVFYFDHFDQPRHIFFPALAPRSMKTLMAGWRNGARRAFQPPRTTTNTRLRQRSRHSFGNRWGSLKTLGKTPPFFHPLIHWFISFSPFNGHFGGFYIPGIPFLSPTSRSLWTLKSADPDKKKWVPQSVGQL